MKGINFINYSLRGKQHEPAAYSFPLQTTGPDVEWFHVYLFLKNSSIPFAPAFPAPMARITVAAPVTASPPA